MRRITITLPDEIAEEIDRFMAQSGAQNRSEAIRDLVRRALSSRADVAPEAPALGVVTATVDLTMRNLGARLSRARLDAHDHHLAALSIPLDHTTSLEVSVTRGPVGALSAAAEALFAERGVAHGQLALIPIAEAGPRHSHAHAGDEHSHITVQSGFGASAPAGFGAPAPAHPFGHAQPFAGPHSHPHPHPHPHFHPHPPPKPGKG